MNKINKVSLLQLWFWLTINCIGWIFIGSIGCLALVIVLLAIHGQITGFSILQNLIQQDYQYVLQTASGDDIVWIRGWLHKINTLMMQPHIVLPSPLSGLHLHSSVIIKMMMSYISVGILGLNLLIIRLYLILCWCPLFLILGMLGLIDGLAQRYIRRVSSGRESALLYHQSKSFILFSLILGIVLELILPIPAEKSEWILVVSAILFGIAIQMTAKSFKKYL